MILSEILLTNIEAQKSRIPRLIKPDDDALHDLREGVFATLPEPLYDFLRAVAENSPYLRALVKQFPEQMIEFLESPADVSLKNILETVQSQEYVDEKTCKTHLRRAKKETALLLAICDLGAVWADEKVMQSLSDFADVACQVSFEKAWHYLPPKITRGLTDVGKDCGLCVIAMGKHGAGELNYSSDIDLIVFYDPDALPIKAGEDGKALRDHPQSLAVKVTQAAIRLLSDQTADGYVFRTDLRLRPDPGASALAVSIAAAEQYYEVYGQNWERAAFIKARCVAGDMIFGDQVRDMIQPFIWRKYLDFAAIEDIHSIKRQIHAVKGGADITFAGHDVKLGRGGIREIEFYAQTQQLILGGRQKSLRVNQTLKALEALVEAGQVQDETAGSLKEAYLYLRHIEHRVQMISDEQTHNLPSDEEALERFAAFCGNASLAELEQQVLSTLTTVHEAYADLFIEHEALSIQMGNLVFTGVESDPETVKNLSDMGFENAAQVSDTIRSWHAGGMRATASPRGRELLTKLVPAIVQTICETDVPDKTFQTFDNFLRTMPAGVQMFSLFLNHPDMLKLLVKLMVVAPRLGGLMARYSRFIEMLFREEVHKESGEPSMEVDDIFDIDPSQNDDDFEKILNHLRMEVSEARFRTSVDLILNDRAATVTGRRLTMIAEQTIAAILPIARKEMERLHGTIEGGLGVIGMGRLGARALTATSDLDLIFVYDVAEGTQSRGEDIRALDGVTYYTRLVRRVVTALSAQTSEGGLYEIDMALRPSGGAGPAAVSFSAFESYYAHDAWTWEEMALVKARLIASDGQIGTHIEKEITKILSRKREEDAIRCDVLDMRNRLLEGKPATNEWDFKRLYGGLTDIDFICQYFALLHGHQNGPYPMHIQDSLKVFVEQGIMKAQVGAQLKEAAMLYENILQYMRATLGGVPQPHEMLPLQIEAFIAYMGFTTLDALKEHLLEHVLNIQNLFAQFIGSPKI